MNSLRTNGMTDVYSIIALASLCDFAFKHRMIAQLMPNSFSEDLKYFYENFEEFKVLKDSLQDFEIFSSNENDLFYRELKKQSLKNEDDPRENMSVIELLNSKSYREQDNYLLAENVLSPVIADWISGGKTGLKIYCPFNSMLNVESSLPRDNQIISPCTSEQRKIKISQNPPSDLQRHESSGATGYAVRGNKRKSGILRRWIHLPSS